MNIIATCIAALTMVVLQQSPALSQKAGLESAAKAPAAHPTAGKARLVDNQKAALELAIEKADNVLSAFVDADDKSKMLPPELFTRDAARKTCARMASLRHDLAYFVTEPVDASVNAEVETMKLVAAQNEEFAEIAKSFCALDPNTLDQAGETSKPLVKRLVSLRNALRRAFKLTNGRELVAKTDPPLAELKVVIQSLQFLELATSNKDGTTRKEFPWVGGDLATHYYLVLTTRQAVAFGRAIRRADNAGRLANCEKRAVNLADELRAFSYDYSHGENDGTGVTSGTISDALAKVIKGFLREARAMRTGCVAPK